MKNTTNAPTTNMVDRCPICKVKTVRETVAGYTDDDGGMRYELIAVNVNEGEKMYAEIVVTDADAELAAQVDGVVQRRRYLTLAQAQTAFDKALRTVAPKAHPPATCPTIVVRKLHKTAGEPFVKAWTVGAHSGETRMVRTACGLTESTTSTVSHGKAYVGPADDRIRDLTDAEAEADVWAKCPKAGCFPNTQDAR